MRAEQKSQSPHNPSDISNISTICKRPAATELPRDSVPRGRLIKLIRQREGNRYLRHDDNGRRMLIALLRFGLSDDSAIGFGHWCEAELPELKRRALRTNKRHVGKLIQMTTNELVEYELWHLGLPVDQTPEEFAAWKKERSKRLARERKQLQRDNLREQKERHMLKLAKARRNWRDEAVFSLLVESGQPMAVAALIEAARQLNDFKGLRDVPLRNSVHRAVKRLEAHDMVMTSKRPGRTGERWVFIPTNGLYHYITSPKRDKSSKTKDLSQKTPPSRCYV